ncbi:signal transduction histidine kinase [Mizugakiibacter sediminis]|uniref:histidine kinase n=1 Tax=Mizugakiibacter sediminis TaxID=1475481 RepID=A0A0K8QQ16_9GAMM|nr:ATP-binding protein [Mizugakiibacter sediminis]GAP66776.1 signal transduction histidine kinase [Mizugakiibacter sediminis]
MTLRRKLLLVALSTLVLPAVGLLYVRQMEQMLRHAQEQALTASARALARALTVADAALPAPGAAWYVQPAVQPIVIDGYGDDWAPLTPWVQRPEQGLRVLLAEDSAWLYLYAEVQDATRTRREADDPAALQADHLVLTLRRGAAQQRYLIASTAPGAFRARPLDAPTADLPDPLDGEWQDDGSGYRIELRIARAQMPDHLALAAYDADAPRRFADDVEPRPLLAYSAPLARELAQLAPDGTRARLLSAEGWLLAEHGSLAVRDAVRGTPAWLSALVYRGLIAPALSGSQALSQDAPRVDAPEAWQALSGVPAASWRAGTEPGSVVLAVAVPLLDRGETRGALLLEQASRSVPLLANRALLGLLLASVAGLLIAGGLLFAFATWLSLRIGRLRDAADVAVRREGRYDGAFPQADAADELGDLARSFARLTDAVGAYTDYLRTLASKLSHELNTPLAIVKSSLDNLEHAALPAEAQPYLARARDGAARLGAIVRAMSESSRMERAIAGAEGEDFDLAQVVRGCAEAYRALAAPRRVECVLPESPLPLHGAPELIAQALDKLFDNALSFTPEDGWIRLGLRALPDGAAIEVANRGPLLPAAMHGRLFDSLVSLRDATSRAAAPHLGLGLYVVRLVAELHNGRAEARNLDDGSGVAFTLVLRGMARQRMV